MKIEGFWDGAYGLSALSEKTRESNHLQISLQRHHFFLSYFKDPECWSDQSRIHDLAARCSTDWATGALFRRKF